ncbi:MAG: nucleotidyltransferase [bacterium]|nr:nucleotidyltransferase [bacterium]
MNLLIPMAGEGSRFKDEGYKVSKPCIPVNGIPMVIQAVKSLPFSEKHIFICRDFHIDQGVPDLIKTYYPKAQFISISELTEGQASTCLLAKHLINTEEELMIGACDNGIIWDLDVFNKLKNNVDCLVWTFRNNAAVVEHPEHYGWVKTDDNDQAIEMSIKKPISSEPKNDHAVVGAFWFKQGKDFICATETMIQNNDRINGEFYVDQCIEYLIKMNKKVKVFEINNYIGWGTPNDLKTFEYWQSFFEKYQWL